MNSKQKIALITGLFSVIVALISLVGVWLEYRLDKKENSTYKIKKQEKNSIDKSQEEEDKPIGSLSMSRSDTPMIGIKVYKNGSYIGVTNNVGEIIFNKNQFNDIGKYDMAELLLLGTNFRERVVVNPFVYNDIKF